MMCNCEVIAGPKVIPPSIKTKSVLSLIDFQNYFVSFIRAQQILGSNADTNVREKENYDI